MSNNFYGPLPLTETVDPGRRAGDNIKTLCAAATRHADRH
jgi:hypothetical protein